MSKQIATKKKATTQKSSTGEKRAARSAHPARTASPQVEEAKQETIASEATEEGTDQQEVALMPTSITIKKTPKPESRVDQLYRKIGTDKVYRVVQDDGSHYVRLIRVLPDGQFKGDEMVV